MSDMGTFRIPIKIESHSPRGAVRAVDGAVVDAGSEYTWIPRPILAALGIQP